MSVNIIDSIWYGKIGIVRVQPEHGDEKFYIGIGTGLNQKEDEYYIGNYGMPFNVDVINQFLDRKIS